jgi:hypothetical protein
MFKVGEQGVGGRGCVTHGRVRRVYTPFRLEFQRLCERCIIVLKNLSEISSEMAFEVYFK